jgi:hypothetical protein
MKKNLLIIIIACLGLSAFSQTPIIFDKTKTQSYLLSYTNGGDQSQHIVNDMLRIISSTMNKPVYQTRIHLDVDEHVWATRNGRQINVYVSYEQVRLTGDLFYKGFDMGDEMVPSNYSFECVLKRKNGPELKRFKVNEAQFRFHNSENRFEYSDTVSNGEYQIEVVSRDFTYRNQAFDRFRDKCQMVDQYYGAEGEIASCYGIADVMDTENFRQIGYTQQQLDVLISRVNRVESAPFWHELNVRSYDPIHIFPKLEDTKRRIGEVQKNINYVQSNLHRYYFESGLQSFNSNKRNNARNDFRQSTSLNPQYPQPIYYLALMDYQDGDAGASMSQLSNLFSLSSVDNDIYFQATQLARSVESAKISEVKRQISHQLYASALTNLDDLNEFCQKIRNYTCNDSLTLLRSDVHNATYQSYLYDAQCDLSGAKYDEAANSTNKAMAYQSQYSSFIPSNEQAIALMQKIKGDHYLALVKRGRSLITSKDYKNAFEALNKASEIESNYSVKRDKQLNDLLRKSKLELLFVDADAAQKMVQANNLPRAREILLAIISDQTTYQLKGNAKLNQNVANLKQSIFSQQCMNAQAEYDGVIDTANVSVGKKDYISALKTFQRALTVAAKNTDCQLNTDSATIGINYTQNPAKYQQDYKKVIQQANSNDFSGATSSYLALTDFYQKNKLSDYQIEHQTLTQFISQYNVNYLVWGATYQVNSQDYESTLTLLNLLKQKKYSRSKTKAIQVSLANGFALNDYKANPSVNAKVKVLEYTKDDSWFKYFAKQYQKQIKSLQKK